MLVSLIFGLIIGALSVIFAFQNIFPVTITFLVWHITASLALLISLSILIGISICYLLSIPESLKNSFAISKLKSENKKLEEKIEMTQKINNEAIISTPTATIIVEK